jgi:hypothetical protein
MIGPAMALSDDQLFDFDRKRLADFDIKRAQRVLDEQRDVYRAQLVAARWIDGWRERTAEQRGSPTAHPADWYDGFDQALREVAAHLRQGDLLPGGGILHDETDSGKL